MNVAQNKLGGEVIKCLIQLLSNLKLLKNFDLQIYGNGIVAKEILKLLKAIRKSELQKLVLSYFDFKNQLLTPDQQLIVNEFKKLPIKNKHLF